MTKAVNKLKSFKCKECGNIYNTLQELKDLGYEVLVIWEKDFTENPTETISKIIEFLK